MSDHDPESGELSHLDRHGQAKMVDVSNKVTTARYAMAAAVVELGDELLQRLVDRQLPKGEAIAVARIAGIQAAKETSRLLPLCHPLPLRSVQVEFDPLIGGRLQIQCSVRCEGPTGVEMEALTGAAVAALAIYDMVKAVRRDVRIGDLRLVRKSGGKSGDYSEADQT